MLQEKRGLLGGHDDPTALMEEIRVEGIDL
jgi:hypothetical protein